MQHLHLLAQVADAVEVVDEDSSIPPWVYLFYLWLIGSFAVYGYRLYRRWFHKVDAADAADVADATGVPTTNPPAATAPVEPARPKSTFLGAVTAAKKPPPDAPSLSGRDELTPTQKLFQEELAKKRQATSPAPAGADAGAAVPEDPAPSRMGFFAPKEDAAAPSRPVADLLAGIVLPCDLAPVLTAQGDFGDFSVPFITAGFEPGEVGRKVGDELERLGYTLRSLNDTEVEARKGADVLVVTLHPDARSAQGEGGRLFPHAPLDTVAVVFSS